MVVASSCFILNLFQLVQREFLMICFAKRHAMHITRNTYVNCKPQRVKYTFDERAGKTFVNFGALGTNSLPNNPSLITDPILLCVILCVGRGVAMGWDCCCKATLLCTHFKYLLTNIWWSNNSFDLCKNLLCEKFWFRQISKSQLKSISFAIENWDCKAKNFKLY